MRCMNQIFPAMRAMVVKRHDSRDSDINMQDALTGAHEIRDKGNDGERERPSNEFGIEDWTARGGKRVNAPDTRS